MSDNRTPVLEIPTPWEIVEDDKGFLHIHHPREDDGNTTGDLVATCFQDDRHALMLRAAPELLKALDKAAARFEHCADMIGTSFNISGTLRVEREVKARHFALEARAAIAKATGSAS